jgi:ketosteroid isomerase-like protein
MMSEALVRRYFDAFARLDGEAMAACYHASASFSDPIFPDLRGERVGWRWRMLTRGATDMHLDYVIVFGDERKAQVEWQSRYRFAGSGREVRNQGLSTLAFWDGRIVRQIDEFDFWRWSRSSVGLMGTLFGGLGPVRGMVQRRAAAQLERYIARSKAPAES